MHISVNANNIEKLYMYEFKTLLTETYMNKTPADILIRDNLSLHEFKKDSAVQYRLYSENLPAVNNMPVAQLNEYFYNNKYAPLLITVSVIAGKSIKQEIHVPYIVNEHKRLCIITLQGNTVKQEMPTVPSLYINTSHITNKEKDELWKNIYKSIELNLKDNLLYAPLYNYVENVFVIEQYIKELYRKQNNYYGYRLQSELPLDKILKKQNNYETLKEAIDNKPFYIKINVSADAIVRNEGKGFFKRDIKSVDITNDYYSAPTVFHAARKIVNDLYFEAYK